MNLAVFGRELCGHQCACGVDTEMVVILYIYLTE